MNLEVNTLKNPTKKRAIHVVLDTNCLFTEAEDKLISQALKELVEETKGNTDLAIHWYLPDIVVAERRYRMIERAAGLLIPVQKIEKLLGHNLNINKAVIEEKVDAVIRREIKDHKLSQLDLNISFLDWNLLLHSVMYRLPPFEKDNEKGLRDYFILEAYWQLSERLPKSPVSCRVLLITSDELLKKAFSIKMKGRSNAELLSDLDKLKSYINILTSDIKEGIIKDILPNAALIFFNKDKKDGLYYKEDIDKRIQDEFEKILKNGPTVGWQAEISDMVISLNPTFLSKDRQKIRWSNKIMYEVKAVKKSAFLPNLGGGKLYFHDSPSAFSKFLPISSESKNIFLTKEVPGGLLGFFQNPQPESSFSSIQKEDKKIGDHSFEVIWEVTLTKTFKLINPKIIDIRHLDTLWESTP